MLSVLGMLRPLSRAIPGLQGAFSFDQTIESGQEIYNRIEAGEPVPTEEILAFASGVTGVMAGALPFVVGIVAAGTVSAPVVAVLAGGLGLASSALIFTSALIDDVPSVPDNYEELVQNYESLLDVVPSYGHSDFGLFIQRISKDHSLDNGTPLINAENLHHIILQMIDPSLGDNDVLNQIAYSNSHLNEHGVEGLVRSLEKVYGLGDKGSVVDEVDYYGRIGALYTDIESKGSVTTISLSHLSEDEIATLAAEDSSTGLAVRYALHHMDSLAIVGNFSVYSGYSEQLSLENHSQQYFKDRALLLSAYLTKNIANNVHGNLPEKIKFTSFLEDGRVIRFDGDSNGYIGGQHTDPSFYDGERARYIFGSEGSDSQQADARFVASQNDDHIYGLGGDDTIAGEEGDDYLVGGRGNDVIQGGSGNDQLLGGDNNDTLTGGEDTDILSGGSGADTFVFNTGDGNDSIVDVEASAGDKIEVNGIDLSTLTFEQQGNNTAGARVYQVEDQDITLSIAENGEATISYGPDDNRGTISIRFFTDGDYGISLSPEAEPAPWESTGIYDQTADLNLDPDEKRKIHFDENNGTYYLRDGGTSATNVEYSTGDFSEIHTQSEDDLVELLDSETFTPINRIKTGDGKDIVLAQQGEQIIEGGADVDFIHGGDGNDRIFAGTEEDYETIFDSDDTPAGTDRDWLAGGDGDDLLVGSTGQNGLSGGAGKDLIVGGAGDDQIFGDRDWLPHHAVFPYDNEYDFEWTVTPVDGGWEYSVFGSTGFPEGSDADTIFGGGGNDRIWGGLGGDHIMGDGGDDLIQGEEGDDVIYGGSGIDDLYGQEGKDFISGDEGNDDIFGGLDDDVLEGGDGEDKLIGGEGNDTIRGGEGGDSISGDGYNSETDEYQGSGDDILYGEGGEDTIRGFGGNDKLYGGDGIDHLYGDYLLLDVAEHGNDWLYGGDGGDHLFAYGGEDFLFGEAGSDYLHGGDGSDYVYGGADRDFLHGEKDNDFLFGGSGNDDIFGEEGDDTLSGGSGLDNLLGGDGYDTYVYSAGDDSNYIHNESGGNKLVINNINLSDVFVLFENNDTNIYVGDYNDNEFGDFIVVKDTDSESPRVCRKQFNLSHAASLDSVC